MPNNANRGKLLPSLAKFSKAQRILAKSCILLQERPNRASFCKTQRIVAKRCKLQHKSASELLKMRGNTKNAR